MKYKSEVFRTEGTGAEKDWDEAAIGVSTQVLDPVTPHDISWDCWTTLLGKVQKVVCCELLVITFIACRAQPRGDYRIYSDSLVRLQTFA